MTLWWHRGRAQAAGGALQGVGLQPGAGAISAGARGGSGAASSGRVARGGCAKEPLQRVQISIAVYSAAPHLRQGSKQHGETLGGMASISRRRRSPTRLTPASDTGRQPTPDNGAPHSGPRMRGVKNRVPEAGPQGVCQIQSRRKVGVARGGPECRPARA